MSISYKFSWQPYLRGQNLTLRPLLETDFPELYSVAANPLIWAQHPQSDRYQEDVFRKYFEGAIKSEGALLVVDNETGKAIGCSRFYEVNEYKEYIAIGFTFLACEYWGGAYNQEMKELMLSYAFQKVSTVIFEVGETNIRSQKAMQKIGGQEIARVFAHNAPHIVYSINKDAFQMKRLLN